jgi:glucokinase
LVFLIKDDRIFNLQIIFGIDNKIRYFHRQVFWCFLSNYNIVFMKKNFAIGADIGGSHISCAAIDLVSGKILRETLTEREVNNQAQANIIIAVWTEALSAVLKKVPVEKVKGIGFAMPGPFDYVKGICYIKGVAKYENLYGFNITDAISSSLGVHDDFLLRFINDASAFAVGEAWAGSASKTDRSLSITLGTGFGSAFISNRIPIVDGPNVPKLGCVYHIPYEDGIADDYFSTRWFIGRYKNITGRELSGAKEVADLAVTDKIASGLFLEFGDKLGLFLAPYLKKFNAEIVVIGGNISHAYYLFGDVLENRLKKENCNCKVALSKLKEDAALLGSAYLLDDIFWKDVQHALPLM